MISLVPNDVAKRQSELQISNGLAALRIELILTTTSNQPVHAGAAKEDVVSILAEEQVHAGAAVQKIVPLNGTRKAIPGLATAETTREDVVT